MKDEPTPLQVQIKKFVKGMAIIGVVIFLLVWGVYYYKTEDILNSLLKGLTLAMSILPEEIPVASYHIYGFRILAFNERRSHCQENPNR
jgi:Ca2+-transporting ATPase